MKNSIILSIAVSFILCACQNSSNRESTSGTDTKGSQLPEDLQKVLDHHGGVAQWKQMKSMSFELPREQQNEVQRIDLNSRNEVINAVNYNTGSDDNGIWLQADSTYKGNAFFYHNLMFYFVSMPFVLADDGIHYAQAETLTKDGIDYPGVIISYQDSIGLSPQDEYYIHYHPETYQMTWLGYTVTYFSKEKTKDVHWIKYPEWQTVNGLLLPLSLDWYKYEDGLPTEFRNKVTLEKMNVQKGPFDASIFMKPENGEYLE